MFAFTLPLAAIFQNSSTFTQVDFSGNLNTTGQHIGLHLFSGLLITVLVHIMCFSSEVRIRLEKLKMTLSGFWFVGGVEEQRRSNFFS